MTFALILLTYLGAVNPARLRLAVPEDDRLARPMPLALGSALVLGLGAVGIAVSVDLLDWLQISPETFRIALGLVLVLTGAWWMVFPTPAAEPEMKGLGAALVPIAFPLLISPALFATVISTGADESAAVTIGSLAISLATLNVLGRVRTTDTTRGLLLGVARFLGLVLIVTAVAFIISGIRDVKEPAE